MKTAGRGGKPGALGNIKGVGKQPAGYCLDGWRNRNLTPMMSQLSVLKDNHGPENWGPQKNFFWGCLVQPGRQFLDMGKIKKKKIVRSKGKGGETALQGRRWGGKMMRRGKRENLLEQVYPDEGDLAQEWRNAAKAAKGKDWAGKKDGGRSEKKKRY